jgi:hypothetical protein
MELVKPIASMYSRGFHRNLVCTFVNLYDSQRNFGSLSEFLEIVKRILKKSNQRIVLGRNLAQGIGLAHWQPAQRGSPKGHVGLA